MSNEPPIEAQVVPEQEQAVAVRPTEGSSGAVATVEQLEQSFALAVRQRELLSSYIRQQLKPGQHFMKLGGQSQKPSLLKEGAEIILLAHGYTPDYEWVSGPMEPPADEKPYQIVTKCTLRRKGDPTSFVGSGLGSAGSHKGSWGRDKKWSYQPRQNDKYLCHNSTLKMSQKSAMISATLNSTGASQFFTQDLEQGEPAKNKAGWDRKGADGLTSHGAASQGPKPAAPAKPAATPATRNWMISALKPMEQEALGYFIERSWLLPTEGLEDLRLDKVPTSKDALTELILYIKEWARTGKLPTSPPPENVPRGTTGETEWWRTLVLHFGKNAGKTLEDLPKETLWGFWQNFKVEEYWENAEGRQIAVKPDKLLKDRKLREALDLAGEHYGFKPKD